MNELPNVTRVLAARKNVLNNTGAGTTIKNTFKNVVRKQTVETRRKPLANVKTVLGINVIPETKQNAPESSKITKAAKKSRTRTVAQSSTKTSSPVKRTIRKPKRKNPLAPQFVAKELENIPVKLKTNLKSSPKKISILAPKTVVTSSPKTASTLSPKPVLKLSPRNILRSIQKSKQKRAIKKCHAEDAKPITAMKMGLCKKSVTLNKFNTFCMN